MRAKLGKQCLRRVQTEKRVAPGATRIVQRRSEENLKLRNYLLEVHSEFEPRAVNNCESGED